MKQITLGLSQKQAFPKQDRLGDGVSRENAMTQNGFKKLDVVPDPNTPIVFRNGLGGFAAEQYRVLRQRLTQQHPDGARILLTSPMQGDGKTLSSINLAWALAETGSRTLLVEVDLRGPSLERVLGCRAAYGVESAFQGKVEPKLAVGKVRGLPLYLAAAAKAQQHPVAILKSEGTRKFLEWAAGEFQWVILDAPPVLMAADVVELCPLTDLVLLVVRARATPSQLVRKSCETLGDRLSGVILNEATLCTDSHYRYLSGYYRNKKKK